MEETDIKNEVEDEEAAMLAEFERLLEQDKSEDSNRVLGQGEIDDLFSGGSDASRGILKALKSSKVYHERLPGLHAVLEKFAHLITLSLHQLSGASVEALLTDITSIPFEDYLAGIPIPSMINVFDIIEWDDSGLLVLDNLLFYRIVEILLGYRDSQEEEVPKKKLAEGRFYTLVEKAIIKNFVILTLEDLSTAFSPVGYVNFRFERQEDFPRFAAVAQSGNAAILAKISVTLNGQGGVLHVVIPYRAFESVKEKLSFTYSQGGNFGQDIVWEKHILSQMGDVEVELKAVLSELTLPLAEVLNWKIGSQVTLDTYPDSSLKIYCNDEYMMTAKAGKIKGKLAVLIDQIVSDSEPK